ncbi:hypothetical protein [Brumimicrobium oceani]|uniref:hypothetical protein n=1 Tax=Brumimicrobium oceani TaxID=2100725 RepID=UPI001304E8E8|nr:hypothetical protein [Brumimicrobium oceani]
MEVLKAYIGGVVLFWVSRRFSQISQIFFGGSGALLVLPQIFADFADLFLGGLALFWFSRRFSQISQIFFWGSWRSFGSPADFRRFRRSFLGELALFWFSRRFSQISQIFFWGSWRSFGSPADFRRFRRSFLGGLALFWFWQIFGDCVDRFLGGVGLFLYNSALWIHIELLISYLYFKTLLSFHFFDLYLRNPNQTNHEIFIIFYHRNLFIFKLL